MQRVINVLISILVTVVAVVPASAQQRTVPKGHLVIIGGGSIPDDVRKHVLDLAGGPKAKVVVLPQASELPETGPETVELWKKFGAADARVIQPSERDAAIAALKEATLIWFPGGDQSKLTKAWENTGVPELIRQRYEQGATVSGTSAGAAVMTKVMITGNDMDLQAITAKKTDTAEGFGLLPGAIVDQHFLKRQRNNRLLSAVLDHPDLVGIGIDESTAIVVTGGNRFDVIGKSSVVVMDARKAKVTTTPAGEPITGTNMALHVLRAGQSWVW